MMWKYLRSSARTAVAIVTALTLTLPVTAGAVTDEGTINPIPTPASGQWLDQLELFLNQEDADRYTLIHNDFVSSGGVISTGAGLTKTPTSLVAFINGFYTTESGNITFADNETTWVIASKDRTGNLGTFTRVSGTHYLTDSVSATEPALPADTVWISEVTTSGGSVTTVTDMRALTPDGITAADTGTVRFDAGVRSIGDVRPEVYTVANLPSTCTEGTIAVLADGDAKDAIVQCDDSNTWRSPTEIAYQLINPALPPYNCLAADTGAVNNACMVVLEDRLTTGAAAELRPTVRWIAKYTITTPVTFAYGSNTTALLDWEGSAAIGGGVVCDFTTVNVGCFTFTTTGSTLNGFTFENFSIGGPGGGSTNVPDVLMSFPQGAAQVTWTGGGLSNFHWEGWRGKCQNCQFVGLTLAMHNLNPDGAGFGEAWFFDMFQLRTVEFDNISVEVTNFDTLLGILNARSQPSGLSVSNVNCSGDGLRLRGFVQVTGAAGLDPKDISITNNQCKELREFAVKVDANSGQRVRNLKIIGNSFARVTGPSATALGLDLRRVDAAIVANNQISDFGICIETDVIIENSLIINNILTDCDTAIVLAGTSYTGNKVEGNLIRNAVTNGISFNNTSGGSNIVANNDFIGTIPTTPYPAGFINAADFFEFGKGPYTLTIADDTVGASVPVATDLPFQRTTYIASADPDGSQWHMGNGSLAGLRVTTRFLSSAGGDVKVSGDGGTTCVILASSGIDRRAEWEWDGAAWILQSGPSSAAC